MNGKMKQIILAVAIIALIGVAFWGGSVYGKSGSNTDKAGARGGFAAGGPGGAGGPMANLSDADRAKIEKMSDSERQEYFQKQMGGRPGGPTRGGTLEGKVLDVAADNFTIKVGTGSQTIYTDKDTVIGYVEGKTAISKDDTVTVVAEPETDGVTTARLVVVQ